MNPAARLTIVAMIATAWIGMAASETPLDRLGNYFSSESRVPSGTEEILDPDQAFFMTASVSSANPQEITVSWDIAEGYYLYRDRFRFSIDSGNAVLGEASMPAGEFVTEPELGKVEVYRRPVAITLGLQRSSAEATTIMLNAGYQGCKENTVCYPPVSKSVPIALPEVADAGGSNVNTIQSLSAEDVINRDLRNNALWVNLAVFLGFGILLAFTPCVFPMLPILSGIIVGRGHSINTRRAFMLSLAYVLAMAITYALLGMIAAALHFNLQSAAQNVWVLGMFSGLFVLLALSMFGFYEIQLPASWQSRLSEIGARRGGDLTGAALMGSASAVIVGPCIAPPLAGALLYVSQTGNIVAGGTALLALGLGMGLPLLIIGTSAGRLLPRAGAWLDTVKQVFGVIMLSVAIWFLERVLPPAVTLFMWGSLATVTAVYMGVFDKLVPGATWGRLWKGAGIILLVYGVTMIIGAAQGNGDKFQPLRFSAVTPGAKPGLVFKRIKTAPELDRELLAAVDHSQTVLLDFYADWCVTCKEMEHKTFSNPGVQTQLQNVILLQADVTANDAEDRALLERFNLFGPPAILFFINGKEQQNLRVIGYMNPEDFIRRIKEAAPP